MTEKKINEIFNGYPEAIYGFTGIEYSPFYPEFKSALVFAVPYGRMVTLKNYSENEFNQGILEAKNIIGLLIEKLTRVLEDENARYYIPPVAQSSEQELLAPFSFKYAAAKAGIGWIGKNDVVITERYGPRIRLSAVLIDEVFSYGIPYKEGCCPEECTACVDICPYGALKGIQWDLSKNRAELIDYQLCNRKRSLYIKKHGRKSACGLCMAACPYGVEFIKGKSP